MNSQEYIQKCNRTAATDISIPKIKLIHGIIGIATETGELMDILKRCMFYSKPLDVEHIKEELGDLCWYISQVLIYLDTSWEEVWDKNIAKLQIRYPQCFSSEDALARRDKGE